MRSSLRRLTIGIVVMGALAASMPAAASAQIAFGACPETNDFACGHLRVPLDYSGRTPGTITLAVRRHRAPLESTRRVAVVALAGGPGQAANPFAVDFAHSLGPIIANRDLIVFDQRGTGNSHPLSCHSFQQDDGSEMHAIVSCADQLGIDRAFYTTAASVADIEALRQAGGYEKLVLYGTSYGTKVAERYAQVHPQNVEALLLDSVVPPNGPDQLLRSTTAAVPRVLRELCSFHACRHITARPVANLRRLVRRMGNRGVRGRYVDRHGVAHTIPVTSSELLNLLIAGDLEPTIRAEFPAAVQAALDGDTAPLVRMLIHGREGSPRESAGIDAPLYYATTCEEESFPWERSSPPRGRLHEARHALRSLGAHTFLPFTASDVFALSDIPQCAYWPYRGGAPEFDGAPLPTVPTLILSGTNDLRTPTSNAREVARAIPGSHLLVVPDTGHSVLGSDPGFCSADALQAFFARRPIKRCRARPLPSLLRPVAIPPRRLAAVAPAHGYSGRPGRTLAAVAMTLRYFSRQLALGSLNELALSLIGGLSLDTGGLRAGWASYSSDGIEFHRYSFVPGVEISGRIATGTAVLHVGGRSAAHGTLRLQPRQRLRGSLGGVPVHLSDFDPQTAAASQAQAARASIAVRR